MVHLLLGGPIIAGETLSRFFTLHVFMIPGFIIALVSLHLRLVLSKGINEYPTPGKPISKATYDAEYAEIIRKEGVAFVPHAIGKDLIFSALIIVAILTCAIVIRAPRSRPARLLRPTSIRFPAPTSTFCFFMPPWHSLPDWMETFVLFVVPAVLLVIFFALPFISPAGEKSFRKRPVAVLTVILVMLFITVLCYLGDIAPWSPK